MTSTSSSTLRFQLIALLGVVIMGIGSFMSCLCATALWSNVGSALLIVSMPIIMYGCYRWNP